MKDSELLSKLSTHPNLRHRIEEILDIAENSEGKLTTADEAEESTLNLVRTLGKDLIQEWSSSRSKDLSSFYEKDQGYDKDGKKNSIGTVASEPSQ